MLITLAHLLVLVVLLPGAALLGIAAAGLAGVDQGIHGFLICTLAPLLLLLVLGGPIFRLLSLRPLILPICPSCGHRHANYHVPRKAWPVAVLICVRCGGALRIVLKAGAHPEYQAGPTVSLRGPGFLGLWIRAVPKGRRTGSP